MSGRAPKSRADCRRTAAAATEDRLRRLVALCTRVLDAAGEFDPADVAGLLEMTHHGLTVRAWGELLLFILPDEYRSPSLPARPTSTAPGSEARLAVYEARARHGEGLFHPRDVALAEALAAAGLLGRPPDLSERADRSVLF